MGLRLHKVVGYGIDDLQTMHGNIVDPRFDRKALKERERVLAETSEYEFSLWLLRGGSERVNTVFRSEHPERSDEAYAKAVENRSLLTFRDKGESAPTFIGSRVHYALETGRATTVVFQPVHTVEPWSRNDDVIDFVEDHVATAEKGLQPTLKRAKLHGIPPYDGQLIRFKPGDDRAPEGVRALKRVTSNEADILQNVENVLRRALIRNDFEFCWRPPLPYDLVAGLVFLEPGIKDIYTLMNDLRPMVYTFWS